MPKMFGKSKKKKALIKDLPTLLKRVQEEHLVSASDIPPSETLQAKLQGCDFTKFPPLKEKLIQAVDQMLDQDIAELMSIVPQDAEEPAISGGAFSDVKDTISPFGYMKCEVKRFGKLVTFYFEFWIRVSNFEFRNFGFETPIIKFSKFREIDSFQDYYFFWPEPFF